MRFAPYPPREQQTFHYTFSRPLQLPQRPPEKWLRTLVKHLFHHHPPTGRIREAAHKTQLHNHKQWEEHTSSQPTAQDMPCSCQHMHTLLRDPGQTPLHDGLLPPHLHSFLQTKMNCTYFSTNTQYLQHVTMAITQRLCHHGLPTALHQHCHSDLQQQWSHHNHSLNSHVSHQAISHSYNTFGATNSSSSIMLIMSCSRTYASFVQPHHMEHTPPFQATPTPHH